MSRLDIKKFLGFSSNPEGVLDNPAIGSDCHNVLIQNGDLVNIPYSIFRKFKGQGNLSFRNLGLYRTFLGESFIIAVAPGTLAVSVTGQTRDAKDFWSLVKLLAPDFVNQTNVFDLFSTGFDNGNFLQVGDYILILAPSGQVFNGDDPDQLAPVFSMIRFKFEREQLLALGQTVTTNHIRTISPAGVHSPKGLVKISEIGGLVNGTYDFAISVMSISVEEAGFRISSDNSTTFQKRHLKNGDLESSAILLEQESSYSNLAPVFQVQFKPNAVDIDSPPLLKLYARQSSQDRYYFISFITSVTLVENPAPDSLAGLKYQVILNNNGVGIGVNLGAEDTSDTAPLSDPIPFPGGHNVPRLCYHGAFYKGKAYYSSIQQPNNTLQISAKTPQEILETGEFATYIEKFEFIGKQEEHITGLIDYQGQLIIFKETETYVLTDDIEEGGSIRLLFKDIGCVNKVGGRGYLVVENVLYFVSHLGLYRFDGANIIKVSDSVHERLSDIPKGAYNNVRLGADTRFKTLYLCFGEVEDTLLYNYVEGTWSKTDGVRQLLTDDQSVYSEFLEQPNSQDNYLVKTDTVELLGDLQTEGDREHPREWSWTSSKFDGGDLERLKHWVYMKVSSLKEGFNYQIVVTATTEKGSIVVESFDELKPLGLHSDWLQLKLEAKKQLIPPEGLAGTVAVVGVNDNLYTQKPFRITGLSLEAHTKGKR